MARTAKASDGYWTASVLTQVRDGNPNVVSRYLLNNLREAGYIEPVMERASHGKGRKISNWVLTVKARRFLGLAKTWNRTA